MASARNIEKELAVKGEDFAIMKEEISAKWEDPHGF